MRNPLRTEAEAFSFVLICAGLFAAVAVAGTLLGGGAALAVFLALGLGIAAGIYMKSDPKVREPAVWERRAPSDRKRVLVVANETVEGRALHDEVVRRFAEQTAEVLVVAPALNTRIRYWTSDEDAARARAEERLEASLAAPRERGIDARGQVGDDDPLQAIEDGVRTFGPDELIVSTHPPGRSNWLERDLVTRVQELYDCPITHVVVDLEQEERAQPT